jgi:hypothetical protein
VKSSKVFRFIVAAIMVSTGCLALMFHGGFELTTICFSMFPVLLMVRSDYLRPVPTREVLVLILLLLGFVAMVLAGDFLLPHTASVAVQRIIRHPVFVIPFWLIMFWGLFRRWKKEA